MGNLTTGFTELQSKFIDFYVELGDDIEAAREAGYKGDDSVLRRVANRNLGNFFIQKEIQKRLGDLEITPVEVTHRIAQIATGTMADFIDFDTKSIDLDKAKKRGSLNLIKKYKVREGPKIEVEDDNGEISHVAAWTETEIELYAADSALKQLAKIFGMENVTLNVVDWRKEASEAGIDTSTILDELIDNYTKSIEGSAKSIAG